MTRDPDDPLERRRRKRAADRTRTVLLAAVLGGAVVLAAAAGTVAYLVVPGLAGPSPARQGEEWNHRELLDHLNGRDGDWELTAVSRSDTPAVLIYPPDQAEHVQNHLLWNQVPRLIATAHVLYVVKYPTAAAARDAAGTYTIPALSWGRFLVAGDADMMARVRTALAVR